MVVPGVAPFVVKKNVKASTENETGHQHIKKMAGHDVTSQGSEILAQAWLCRHDRFCRSDRRKMVRSEMTERLEIGTGRDPYFAKQARFTSFSHL